MHTQLHQIVATMASGRGDAPALTFKDTTVTYAELWDDVTAFAGGLNRIGLQPGERVAVYLDKRIETVVSVFGASAGGAVFVPINPLLRAQAGRLHPRRLQRPRARHLGGALRAAAR